MPMTFDHITLGQRVLFGSGRAAANLAAEVGRHGAASVMVIVTESARHLAEEVCRDVDIVLWFHDVAQHVPVKSAEAARTAAVEHDIDMIVSVGGGSTTGLAKAVALTTGIPIVAVPTTYAGSEATNVWGMTENRTKTTGVDDRVLPGTVIYDARLTLSLPPQSSVASGLNGLAHCVDSLWAPQADPINQALALEGARALVSALPTIARDGQDLEAREEALYGSYLAGVAFASAGSGLHHKICHVLGGTFDLPHAQTHAIVLPHVLALNAPAVPRLAARLATALGAPSTTAGDPAAGDVDAPAAPAVRALHLLYTAVDAPRRLADHGFTATDIPHAVERILAVAPASNPVPVTEANINALLTDACTGAAPDSVHIESSAEDCD